MNQAPSAPAPRFRLLFRLAAAFSLATLAAGCLSLKPAKNETRYYLLTPESANAPADDDKSSNRPCLVRLRPVDLAGYLQTQDIAVRTAPNQIQFLLFQRWAEPLDSGIRRVVAENLRAAPEVRGVLIEESGPTSQPVYAISIRVLACEGISTNKAGSTAFEAAWQITRSGPQPAVLDQGLFRAHSYSWNPGDYAQLASQLSRAADDFSKVLLEALTRHTHSKSEVQDPKSKVSQ